jgi:hypothetical protein
MEIVKKLNQQIDMTMIIDDDGDLLLLDENDNICFRIDYDYVWIFIGKIIDSLEKFDNKKDKTK